MSDGTYSDPNKPGTQTTEGRIAIAVAAFGAVISGLSVMVGALKDVFPTSQWIIIAAGIIGGLASMVTVASKFIAGRSNVKVGQLNVEAAQLIKDAEIARSAPTAPAPTAPTLSNPVNP